MGFDSTEYVLAELRRKEKNFDSVLIWLWAGVLILGMFHWFEIGRCSQGANRANANSIIAITELKSLPLFRSCISPAVISHAISLRLLHFGICKLPLNKKQICPAINTPIFEGFKIGWTHDVAKRELDSQWLSGGDGIASHWNAVMIRLDILLHSQFPILAGIYNFPESYIRTEIVSRASSGIQKFQFKCRFLASFKIESCDSLERNMRQFLFFHLGERLAQLAPLKKNEESSNSGNDNGSSRPAKSRPFKAAHFLFYLCEGIVGGWLLCRGVYWLGFIGQRSTIHAFGFLGIGYIVFIHAGFNVIQLLLTVNT